jgi:DsbC/DsbD-like thiol-disulfide interchange protein
MYRRSTSVFVLACVAAAALGVAAVAQQPPLDLSKAPQPGRIETRHLVLTMSTASAARNRVTLAVEVTPKPKMHVYAPEQKDVIPLSLQIEPADGVRPGAAKLPKPEKYFFAPLNETQFVYSRPFRITHEVTLLHDLAPLTIKGTLRYQACDDAVCYVPQTVAISWTVTKLP